MAQTEYTYFPLIPGTKEPAVPWRAVKPGQYQPIGDHGIALRADQLVVDADPRNYPEGRDVLAELIIKHKLARTRTVVTPRGGFHLYLLKPPHLNFAKEQPAYPGIDFLSERFFCVGPGSHTVAGKNTAEGTYQFYFDVPAILAPQSLLDELVPYAEPILATGEVSLLHFDKFVIECQIAPPAVQGQHGSDALYALACRGRDLGLPQEAIYQALAENWNYRNGVPYCQPPWSESELFNHVKHAFRYAKNGFGAASASAAFSPDMAAPDANFTPPATNVVSMSDHQDRKLAACQPDVYKLDKNGNIVECLANVAAILRHDPAFKGRIIWNEFANCLEWTERPYWRAKQLNQGLDLSKRDRAFIQTWFSNVHDWELTDAALKTALHSAATSRHPVREYLDSLVWDGKPRIDSMLRDTAGAANSRYVRNISKCLMIAAVKRIYEPGCKQDYVPILESPQGYGKQKWIATLGGEWYSASQLVQGDKDTYQNLRGRWFVELPELDGTFTEARFRWLKGVVAQPTDVYRPSYGEAAVAVPRESIFLGSINPAKGAPTYLQDDENRRYWPITCGKMDIERLAKDRDQLFAEAVHRYRQGEKAYIEDTIELAEIIAEQEKRREQDPWDEILAPWVSAHRDGFTPREVYAALGYQGKDLSSSHRKRLYACLARLGCKHNAALASGGYWTKPLELEDLL